MIKFRAIQTRKSVCVLFKIVVQFSLIVYLVLETSIMTVSR